MRMTTKKIIFVLFFAGALGSWWLLGERVAISDAIRSALKSPVPAAVGFKQINNRPPVELENTPSAPQQVKSDLNLAVPFTSQAPHGNWEQPYQDACEEASIAMVHYFYSNKTFTALVADREILDLVSFEQRRFGYGHDITAEETANLIKNYYDYKKVEVIADPGVDLIKSILAKGLPVIAPVYGQALGNPYFTPPGPNYHMLVIKGYINDKFITNDPGTRRGADYLYTFPVLMNAIHDYNSVDMAKGRKVIIVIHPEK